MGQNCCSDHAPDHYNSSGSTRQKGSMKESVSQPGGPAEVFRFFMVGMGSAGKSTVIKQLQKLCHDRPTIYKMFGEEWQPISHEYPTHEKERYRRIIRRNVIDLLSVLEYYVHEWSLRPSSSTDAHLLSEISENFTVREKTLERQMLDSLVALIRDPAIQTALSRHSEMTGAQQVADGTIAFLTETKITEDYRFGIRGMRIQIHDIGGQKVERGKLLSYISTWMAADRSGYRNFLLYVTSMAEYNIMHEEHPGITLLDESLMMMQNILELPTIQNCGVIIFFNKEDVYREKVEQCRINEKLREETLRLLGPYMKESDRVALRKGNIASSDAMKKAIAKKFTEVIKAADTRRYKGIYHRFTCAVDTKMMGALFNAIEGDLVNQTIETASWMG